MNQFVKSSQHPIDGFIIEFDRALRSIVGATSMRRLKKKNTPQV
jgi:ubiquinone biosynthesis monooxygenase Coq7